MATFGNTATNGGADSNATIWYRGATFTCPGTGTQNITELSAFVKGTSATSSIRLAIYNATGTTLIAQGTAAVSVASGTLAWAGHLTAASMGNASLTGGTAYILALTNNAVDLTITVNNTGDTGTFTFGSTNFTAGWPASLAAGSGLGETLAIRCIVTAAGGGTAFTQTLTESVTLSDLLANRTGKVCAEAVTWSDVLTRLTGKTLADTWTPGDVLVKQTGKPLSESVTFSDVMTTTKVFLRTLAEVFTFSDTLARSTGKVLSDAWTLSDVLGRFIGKTFSDLWTPSDTLVKQTQKPLSESVTFSDLLSTTKVFLRTLTESLTWSDTLARRTGKTLTETATLSDVLSTAGRYFRTLTESITFSDVFSGIIQSILAAAKACETFFLKADKDLKVAADTVVFAVAADSTLLSVSPDTQVAKVGADKALSVPADITTFTDVGC